MMELNGVINFYKEKGQTSFKAVHQLKRILSVQKIGHTGTLDPLAQGVLPVCLGKATRTSMYIMDSTKEYLCTMKLGFETDTLDLEGNITRQSKTEIYDEKRIKNCLKTFIGDTMQIPPAYSAIKINGKKLYQYARNNQEIEIKARPVHIDQIILKNFDKDEISFLVTCEKGTYIRSLCRDIGYGLNSYGTMTELIRQKTGKFSIDNAHTLEDIIKHVESGTVNSIVENADDYMKLEVITLNEQERLDYLKGIKLPVAVKEGEYLIKDTSFFTLGIGVVSHEGMLKSKKRLF